MDLFDEVLELQATQFLDNIGRRLFFCGGMSFPFFLGISLNHDDYGQFLDGRCFSFRRLPHTQSRPYWTDVGSLICCCSLWAKRLLLVVAASAVFPLFLPFSSKAKRNAVTTHNERTVSFCKNDQENYITILLFFPRQK